jgi:hypothetical protein
MRADYITLVLDDETGFDFDDVNDTEVAVYNEGEDNPTPLSEVIERELETLESDHTVYIYQLVKTIKPKKIIVQPEITDITIEIEQKTTVKDEVEI